LIVHRIHIVAVNPRTGTTLLAECMRLSFDIALSETHEKRIHHLRHCRGVYLTKTPRDLYFLDLRLKLDPRFYAICMMRDPRDTVVSKHGSRPDEYWSLTSLSRFKEGWQIIQRYADHPRFMWVKYEDLIAHPDEVQDRIARRLPFLRRTGRFSDFHKHATISAASSRALNGVRPIDGENRGKWLNHIDRLKQKLDEDGPIDDELIALGYETDRNWMAAAGIQLEADRRVPSPFVPSRKEVLRISAAAVTAAACARLGLDIG
jgi:hypothetical protein